VTAKGRLLGVDYGQVRVGLAICDTERIIASPLTTYTRRDAERDAVYFRALMKAEEVGGLVVGLPVHLSGREGEKAAEARVFGTWLANSTHLPLIFWDERFTTREAEGHLKSAGLSHQRRKERRDRVAAQIRLQSYLDAGCPGEQAIGPLEG
jgi:putative Holliday junction resolvase